MNLDGLVNNDIYEHARDNTLLQYLAQVNVSYVIDFDWMFVDTAMRRRGGYDDAAFQSTLRPVTVFDRATSGWKGLTLYRIDWGATGAAGGGNAVF